MRKTVKNVLIGGGVLALIYFLYSKFGKEKDVAFIETKTYTPPSIQVATITPTTQVVAAGGIGGQGGSGSWQQDFPDVIEMERPLGNQTGGIPIEIVIETRDTSSQVIL
jgi:hypothetical protein